jgi:hypothetical protein
MDDKPAGRFGVRSANGPILQGLIKPSNDLSRGGTAEDVVNTVILAVQQTALCVFRISKETPGKPGISLYLGT